MPKLRHVYQCEDGHRYESYAYSGVTLVKPQQWEPCKGQTPKGEPCQKQAKYVKTVGL
jgi:hypothetical protein